MPKIKKPYHRIGRFDNNLKHYRTKAGLSQMKLAELTGVSRTYISEVEIGASRLTLKMAERMAPHLHCEPHDLLGMDAIKYTGNFVSTLKSLVFANYDEMFKDEYRDEKKYDYFLYMICFMIVNKKMNAADMEGLFRAVEMLTKNFESEGAMSSND